MALVLANSIGVDDGPFARRGDASVFVAAPVFARTRLDGLLTTTIDKDGNDSTRKLIEMIQGSPFHAHAKIIYLGGLTLGGFNVVDGWELFESTQLPVLVVTRRLPDRAAIRSALVHLPDGEEKWKLFERAGESEPLGGVYVQRFGLDREQARATLEATTIHGALPEPLRVAHLLAGGFVEGRSRGRA